MSNKPKIFDEMRDDFLLRLRIKLGSMLYECTAEQRKRFEQMYKSIDEVPYEMMETAFCQVENTIRKNEERK